MPLLPLLNSPEWFLQIKMYTKAQNCMRKVHISCSDNRENWGLQRAFRSIRMCAGKKQSCWDLSEEWFTYSSKSVLSRSTQQSHFLKVCQLSSSSCHFNFVRTWGSPANASEPVQVRLVFNLRERNMHQDVLFCWALTKSHALGIQERTYKGAAESIINKLFIFSKQTVVLSRWFCWQVRFAKEIHRQPPAQGRTISLSHTYITLQLVGLLCMFHI